MNNGPTLSIIIPMYNTGDSTTELIGAILSDKFQDLEIIVIDDGSADDSFAKIKKIKNPKIKLFHQKNFGASSARNLGIKQAKGQYISFIDSDDMIRPNFISFLMRQIRKNNIDLVVTGIFYHRLNTGHSKSIYTTPVPKKSNDESFKAYILKLMNIDGRMYSVNNKIFKAEIIKNNNLLFDASLNFAEDTKFVLDYLNHIVGEIAFIYKPLYIYNFGTDTSTIQKSSLIWSNWQTSYDHLKQWVGNCPTKQEKSGLRKIRLRWTISHALAVARSQQSFRNKIKHVSPILLLPAEIIVKFRR